MWYLSEIGTASQVLVLSCAMTESTATLVLGAGYAGLTCAALLAHEGHEVTLLESHDTLGGCASFYRVGECTFDVGATTVSGVVESQPAGQVFMHLGVEPEFIKQDPGMIIRMPQFDVVRHADPDRWIEEAEQRFPGGRQAKFWKDLYAMERRVWSLVQGLTHFPPTSVADVFRLVTPSALSGLPLVAGLVRPVDVLLEKYGLHRSPDFRSFIDEQLLISTQNTSGRAPYLTAAMGLTYPSETYYPVGGMYRPALQLMRHATARGAKVKFRRRVTEIIRQPNGWSVTCSNGETYTAQRLVSSIPIWNMASITRERTQSYFTRLASRFDESWCAITLYLTLNGVPRLPSQYVQLHTDAEIPYVHSKSLFLTLSHPDDRHKAPQGLTTITVSTHAKADDWRGLTAEEHDRRRDLVRAAMLDVPRDRAGD